MIQQTARQEWSGIGHKFETKNKKTGNITHEAVDWNTQGKVMLNIERHGRDSARNR